MAAPSVTSTKETTNYARLCRLLVDVGSQALRNTFDQFYKAGTLHTFLFNHRTTLQKLKVKRILNPTQWSKLYPAVPATVSSASFDITLLNVLLRNICGLSPPTTTGSWDKLPPQTDLSREADIVRIKWYRNTVYGHAEKASVDDATFNSLWQPIRIALVNLGGTSFATAITKLETECMDPDIEKHYIEVLKQWKKDEDNIKDKIEGLDKKLDETAEQLKDMNKTLHDLAEKEIDRKKPRSELPEEESNIHGRTKEVDSIVRALSDDSNSAVAGVLVSGIAGVGKSTIAIQTGHQLKNKFESIVKFCFLRGASSKREKAGESASEVEGELREIMNVCVPGHQQTSENPRHVLLNWCRRLEYDMILILDNAEDAMEDQTRSSFIDLLRDLRTCSKCKIKFLITSRCSDMGGVTTGLNIKHVEIGPLDTKESIQVLKDGAKFLSDSRPEKEGKLDKIAELCENIPLALRLAGSLLSSVSEYTPDELIQELENNPTKTLGLERMMEIAFEKLDKSLKDALVCLSVFVRSFDRNAAKALLGLYCTDHLMKLKQRCLIQKQHDRYLIHLLIRSFAKHIGQTEEYRHILAHGQQCFVEYFLSLMLKNSTKYWGKDTCKESFDLFNVERLNLESTLRDVGKKKIRKCKEMENVVNACQQIAPYIEYCVPFELYYDFLEGILHFAESQGKITSQVEILFLLYRESRKHGSNKKQKSQDFLCQAIKLHDENRQLFKQEGLSEVFYLSHYGRYLSQDCRQRKEAKPFLDEAISIHERRMYGATFDKAGILVQKGHNAKLHKDGIKCDEALENYLEALRFRQVNYGQHLLTAFSYKDLADYYLYIEEYENAEKHYDEAIHVLEDMEILEQIGAIPIFKNLGICYQKSGKIDESRRMFERGSEIADTIYKEGNHKWKVWIKTYLAVLLYKEYPGEVARADKISKEVLKMGEDLTLEEWPSKEELEKLYKRD